MIALWIFTVVVACIMVGIAYAVYERLTDINERLHQIELYLESDDPDPDDSEPIVEFNETNVVAFRKVGIR